MTDLPDSIAWVSLNNGTANAIDAPLLSVINQELDRAQNAGARALVLTGYDKFFSAGLNLKTLPSDHDGMEAFIRTFEDTMERLWSFPTPVISAVNGHAIAGGCILACCGDRRIAVSGRFKLGVSEVSLGIVFPAIAFEVMRATLNSASASEVLLAGELMSPEEAVQAGIIHRVVDEADFRDAVLKEATRLAAKPPFAFQHSKSALRALALERAADKRETCRRLFLETWFSDEVRERRQAIMENS